jgi:hypothetical protein
VREADTGVANIREAAAQAASAREAHARTLLSRATQSPDIHSELHPSPNALSPPTSSIPEPGDSALKAEIKKELAATSAQLLPLAPEVVATLAPKREAPAVPREPLVQIGSIEIVITAPAAATAAAPSSPARASDFASRHYLRGL